MNVASRKKVSNASMASGAPKTSPTNLEYSLQFIPNSNSRTMPVTTPTAKQIRNGLLQNLTIFRYFGFPVRYQAVCISARKSAIPMDTGTKKKWYTVVAPNCRRANSRPSTRSPTGPDGTDVRPLRQLEAEQFGRSSPQDGRSE